MDEDMGSYFSSAAVLIAAALEGNVAIVKDALAAGVHVDARRCVDGRDIGHTALMVASKRGHLDVLQCLITAGADVNACYKDALYMASSDTALMLASSRGHVQIVETLLAAGADVNARNNSGTTALMDASSRGHVQIVETLLAAGADVNARNNSGTTALKFAVRFEYHDVVAAICGHVRWTPRSAFIRCLWSIFTAGAVCDPRLVCFGGGGDDESGKNWRLLSEYAGMVALFL